MLQHVALAVSGVFFLWVFITGALRVDEMRHLCSAGASSHLSLQFFRALAVSPPCLANKKKTRLMQNKLNNVFRTDLLPLEVKWACICARKELRFTQDECVVRNPGCCYLDECPCCSCLGFGRFKNQFVEGG